MATCLAFTVPMHAVKFLCTAAFHWGLKVATHCCVVVHLCFICDQPDKAEISQIQLQSRGLSAMLGMQAVKFLYIATFHWALKIATLCFRQINLPWLWTSSDITVAWWMVGWLSLSFAFFWVQTSGPKETTSGQNKIPSGQFVWQVGKSALELGGEPGEGKSISG